MVRFFLLRMKKNTPAARKTAHAMTAMAIPALAPLLRPEVGDEEPAAMAVTVDDDDDAVGDEGEDAVADIDMDDPRDADAEFVS